MKLRRREGARPVRVVASQIRSRSPLRREIERRTSLPIRPSIARRLVDSQEIDDESDDPNAPMSILEGDLFKTDPGWVFETAKSVERRPILALLADLDWWRHSSKAGQEAIQRLWRVSVGVASQSRRIAMEEGFDDPERIARAGLLHGLGLWLAGSADPDWLAAWFALPDLDSRRDLERDELGDELDAIARRLVERTGCDPLIADAVWLYADADGAVNSASKYADSLKVVQHAYTIVDQSPWGSQPWTNDPKSTDARLKVLVADVQSRTGADFVDSESNAREEALTRSNARLRLDLARRKRALAQRDALIQTLASSSPADSLDHWAESAALAIASEPSVNAATVVWDDSGPSVAASASKNGHAPAIVRHLGKPGYPKATLQVWTEAEATVFDSGVDCVDAAWNSWTALVASHHEQSDRLQHLHRAVRKLSSGFEERLRVAKLEALAEFAAGAGHELNNPLAVIVGRAQLLLVHETDPKIARSLRAILNQAQRAHRILRDLMYVARPPEPRHRFCQPDEIIKASLRDARNDSEDREIKLQAGPLEHASRVWADPDGLRHLADTLVRNALEATPKGGQIRFSSVGDAKNLRWTVHDNGIGIGPNDGAHLFDPFYCGRQAGRGLGMGLPRAARFVEAIGGEIRWRSNPKDGTSFQVLLPLTEGPKPPTLEKNSTIEV